jgi:hypothetical protein
VIPAKGTTEIVYEPHIRSKNIIVPGNEGGESMRVTREFGELTKQQVTTITPVKDQYIKITVPNAQFLESCDSELDTNHTKGSLSINAEDNSQLVIMAYSSSVNSLMPYDIAHSSSLVISTNMAVNEYFLYVKKNVPVTFTLVANGFCSDVRLDVSYSITEDTTQQVSVPFGGFRVASTIDNPISGNPIIKNYSYSPVKVVKEPYFLELQQGRSYCEATPYFFDQYYYSLSSNNLGQLNATTPNIFYETVSEEIVGKGKVIHTFDVSGDYFGKTLIGKDIAASQWTNFGWKNGKELNTAYKDKNGNAIYKNAIEIIRQEGLIIDDYKKLNKYNA